MERSTVDRKEGDAANEKWVFRGYGGLMTGDGAMGYRNGESVIVAIFMVVWLMSCACLRLERSRALLKRGCRFQNQKL